MKASISVYLCLVLCVLLSLIFACIDSVRLSCGRAAVSCSLEEGLFSLFSEYDRTMYEEYGLLVLDGGFGGNELQIGRLVREVTETTEDVLSPPLGVFGTTPEKLYRITWNKPAVTGYLLATDQNFLPIRAQICELMTAKIGIDAVQRFSELLPAYADAVSEYSFTEDVDAKTLKERYEAQKEQSKEMAEQLAELTGEGTDTAESGNTGEAPAEIPKDFKNPLENLAMFSGIGVYVFVMPKNADYSLSSADPKKMLSSRTKREGMNLVSDAQPGFGEKILWSEYALDFFPNFLEHGKEDHLQYQAECLIAGNASDPDNLRAIIDRLILIREGFNYLYLFTSADKQAEIQAAAAAVSTLLAMPEAEKTMEQILMLFWAYAESVVDVRELLAKGKVPLFKDNESWQVDLDLLGILNRDSEVQGSKKGLTYTDYLRILLYMVPDDQLLNRMMNMLEYNRRQEEGMENFCLDCCITAFEAEYSGRIGKHAFTIDRSYGYDM